MSASSWALYSGGRPPAGWQALPGWRHRLARRCALRRPPRAPGGPLGDRGDRRARVPSIGPSARWRASQATSPGGPRPRAGDRVPWGRRASLRFRHTCRAAQGPAASGYKLSECCEDGVSRLNRMVARTVPVPDNNRMMPFLQFNSIQFKQRGMTLLLSGTGTVRATQEWGSILPILPSHSESPSPPRPGSAQSSYQGRR